MKLSLSKIRTSPRRPNQRSVAIADMPKMDREDLAAILEEDLSSLSSIKSQSTG